jgi:hypothetical protein
MSHYAKRSRDFSFMSWITAQTCCVCEAQHKPQFSKSYAHHAGQRAFGRKADDRTCIPLCWKHHDRGSSQSIHTLGKAFWTAYGLDRVALIAEYNERYELETGREAAA